MIKNIISTKNISLNLCELNTKHMKEETNKIKVLVDGPYEVTGKIPLNELKFIPNQEGASVGYEETRKYPEQDTYLLCRCGKSQNKPFCDGNHSDGFVGTETASHATYREMADLYEGKQIDLLDAEAYCVVARFCDTDGQTWNLVEHGTTEEAKEIAINQCNNCPGGRLTAVTKDGKIIEPNLPQEISILVDPAARVRGPIWVKGGIAVEDAKGRVYPIRNRVALCRCGKSKNKPFCDAQHMRNQGELY